MAKNTGPEAAARIQKNAMAKNAKDNAKKTAAAAKSPSKRTMDPRTANQLNTEAAKSSSKKAATATKPATKTAAKPEKTSTPRDPNALRKPQVRMLEALSKAKGPLNRHALKEKASVDIAYVAEFAGKLDPAKRKACDENYTKTPSLVARGYAKVREIDVEGKKEVVWEITAAGRAALAKAQKA